MTVFASVFAVLSPNLVSRIPEGQTKTDLFESIENECGVVLGKGVEDVCTIQGNWESLQKVYNFLEGAAFIEASGLENEAKVIKKTHITQVLPCINVSNEDEPTTSDEVEEVDDDIYSNTHMISILNGPTLEQSENMRENHAEEKNSASDDENDMSGIQIVATWGNAFSEDVPNIPPARVNCDEVKQEPVSDTEDSLDKEAIMQSYNEHYSLSQPVFPGIDPFNEREKSQNQKSTSSSDLCLPNAESITANCSSLLAGILCSTETKLKLKNKIQTEKKDNNESVSMETENNHANGDESVNNDGSVEKRDQIKIIIRPPKMPPKKRNKSKKSMKKYAESKPESKVTDPAKLRVTHEMKCGLCTTKKRFRTVDELNQHNHTHHMTLNTGSGRYKTHACSVCGKVLLSKHSLEEHLYVHQGLRPFSCSYCSMTFNHRKSLRRHELLHTDTQRLACQTCGKTFNRKDSLKSHIKAHEHCEDKKIEETEDNMT